MKKSFILLLLLKLFFSPVLLFASDTWERDFIRELKNGGAIVESADGSVLFSFRSTDYFVPASTIKIATVAAAMHYLGENFRSKTEFFILKSDILVIKAYGDPYLTSEEIANIAKGLSSKLSRVSGFLLDTSYFESPLLFDGVSSSLNPYDAVNGALIANFNTAYIEKLGSGKVISAEPQTPITPIIKKLAKKVGVGKQRINLGGNSAEGAKYFAELLTYFLRKNGIDVVDNYRFGNNHPQARLIYEHHSSRNLSEISKGLLEFSTNFLANQLFLLIGVNRFGPPASVGKGMRAMSEFYGNKLGWKKFKIFDGAGLSHQNKIQPRQMNELLRYFEPYRHLLPVENKIFQAKTGTLKGVNTYAGYFNRSDGQVVYFTIFVNDNVPFDYKFKLAKKIYNRFHSN